MSKVLANGLVILTAVTASMFVVVRTLLDVPIAGSLPLFLLVVSPLVLLRRKRLGCSTSAQSPGRWRSSRF